jgi:hypothetical protein
MKKSITQSTNSAAIKSSTNILKQAVKKSVKLKKAEPVLNEDIFEPEKMASSSKKSKFLMLPLFIIVLAAIIYFGKGYLVIAMVNNQPITRLSVLTELEKSQGKKVLDQKINESLIFQEAQKNNISISDQDVTDRIAKIEEQIKAQGQTLDAALTQQGMSREDLNKQIKIELIVEKLIGKDIQITDEEINQSFEQGKTAGYYPKEANLDSVKEDIKSSLMQQKLGTQFSTWMEDLRNKSAINYFVSY